MTEQTPFIGRSAPRVDARAKVTGEARYPGDLEMPRMLHMKILFAERPHARIVNLDTSGAAHLGAALENHAGDLTRSNWLFGTLSRCVNPALAQCRACRCD